MQRVRFTGGPLVRRSQDLDSFASETRMLSASARKSVLCVALPKSAEAGPQHPGRNMVTERLRPNSI